jgi:DNA endonuclease
MGSRPGIGKRPTIEREQLYNLVLDLRGQGPSYNGIIKRIKAERGVNLGKSHISGWINGKHRPFGYVRAFDATPKAELAYVIGGSLVDASTSTNRNYSHKIKLRVIDREFALEFARCLGVLLCRNPPLVKWREATHSWYTEVSSLLLQNFLRLELKKLTPTISHCDDCKAAFLRGFFDSEGSMSARTLTASNEDLELLRLAYELLGSLGVETMYTLGDKRWKDCDDKGQILQAE